MTAVRGRVLEVGGIAPRIHPTAFVAPGALVAGDVEIGAESSVWPGCVLRGDYGRIVVGRRTNVQDGTVIHATETLATVLGDDVVVGHGVRLEGCVVADAALLGMGSVVLHEAHIGRGALVAAGAVVTPGTDVPPGATVMGVPATVREARDDSAVEAQVRSHLEVAQRYAEIARRWMTSAREADDGGTR